VDQEFPTIIVLVLNKHHGCLSVRSKADGGGTFGKTSCPEQQKRALNLAASVPEPEKGTEATTRQHYFA
jgi:hypothetical protein